MSEPAPCRIDGHDASRLAADDRGLAYGDGVFRTLCVVDGRPIAWPFHIERLEADCARLALIAPARDALTADIDVLCGAGGRFVVKIMVTRGSGGRGYAPPESPRCRRVVSRHEMPSAPVAPLSLPWSELALAEQPALAGIKHLNRLEQVLARAECSRRKVADLAMCDARGHLIATTMRNVILADADQRWVTPSLTRAGVAGATRARLLHARAEQANPIAVCDIDSSDLSRFSAAIACNSIGGAIALDRIGTQPLGESGGMADQANRLLERTA